jgi:hypothetical protein
MGKENSIITLGNFRHVRGKRSIIANHWMLPGTLAKKFLQNTTYPLNCEARLGPEVDEAAPMLVMSKKLKSGSS